VFAGNRLIFKVILTVLIALSITLTKPTDSLGIDYNLTGQWAWSDRTSGGNYFYGTAEIRHDGTTLTLTWIWHDQFQSEWTGGGFTQNETFFLDGTYNNGQLTAHWDGVILQNGNRLEGTWAQFDSAGNPGGNGTFTAQKSGPLPSATPLPTPSPSPSVSVSKSLSFSKPQPQSYPYPIFGFAVGL